MNHTNFMLLGCMLIFIGILIIMGSTLFFGLKDSKNVKFSFFGLIGPFPFGVSNDKRLFFFSVIITLIIIVTVLLFYLRNIK